MRVGSRIIMYSYLKTLLTLLDWALVRNRSPLALPDAALHAEQSTESENASTWSSMMAEMSTFEWKWRRKPAKEGDRPHGKEVTIAVDGEGALYAGKWTIRCILRRQVKLGHDIWVLEIDRLDAPPPPAVEDYESEEPLWAGPQDLLLKATVVGRLGCLRVSQEDGACEEHCRILRRRRLKIYFSSPSHNSALRPKLEVVHPSAMFHKLTEKLVHRGKKPAENPCISDTGSSYQPLPNGQHIRLLNLNSGKGSQPLSGKLWTYPLEDAPEFDAISYVWGERAQGSRLGSIPLTENLASALRRVRLRDRSRLIWADQICINQADIEERSQQVTLMADIYRRSYRTLIVVGNAPRRKAKEVSSFVAEISYTIRHYLRRSKGAWSGVPMLLQSSNVFHDPRWKAFADLCSRPWFGRLWVVQEAALSADACVLFGDVEIACQQNHATMSTVSLDTLQPDILKVGA
ncbi:heterokaryon incompatibility protein-domain-containing protein [Lasiosphaeria miniovina]|uniref:Heterokaryon incompatibility protein-domain-containing protein n=1 Tax=Lasiosphaeria miniovina TaxID=1954250 RepID=A0AA39ZYX1_9PEZI|nr:heterokaryon incompatibility protein-domain-containing protein [Lasiosphaeria miniovina]KAK0706211.1 heterokaryon incompatibility protein-domain-containing protein [Lasiosphaeria miniovina]